MCFPNHGETGTIPCQSTCELWCTKWHCNVFVSKKFDLPLSVPLHQRPLLIFIFTLNLSEGQADKEREPQLKHCFFGYMDHWKENYICFDEHLTGFYETHEGPKCRNLFNLPTLMYNSFIH